MMLSKRMTAKSLELKPASQARKRIVKESSDCQPAGCDRPPDRPPPPAGAPGPVAASELPRLLASAWEFEDDDETAALDLCFWSGAECSAMLVPGLLAFSPPNAQRRRSRSRLVPSARFAKEDEGSG